MKFRVQLGKEFPIENVEVIRARTEERREKTKQYLALGVSGVALASLAISGLAGFFEGNFEKLDAVSLVAIPLITMIIGYYFANKR